MSGIIDELFGKLGIGTGKGDWQAADSAPNGKNVATAIAAAGSYRSFRTLVKHGPFWFDTNGKYVSEPPTHWRPL